MVLDLSKLRGVRVAGGRATVGPGAQLIDVQRALTRRGLTVPSGSCPSVGIGGLALGGGHGLAGRRFGLTSDNLLAARIVTADGRVRHADANTNEDLYWACRGGGGGNFGIVTALTLKTHRAPGGTWFSVSWPWSQAEEALAAWQRFAPEAPPALTSIFSLGTSGGSGSPRVAARRAVLRRPRQAAQAGEAADPRGGCEPQQRRLELLLARAALGRLSRRRPRPRATGPRGRASSRSPTTSTSGWGREGRATMIDWIERRQRNPSLGSGALLLDAYGGALNRPAADATAFVHRDMLFSLQYLAYFNGAAAGGASRRWINGVWRALRPHVSGEAYQNYIDPQLEHWQRAYYGSNLERLREIKKQVDPDFRFRFRQAIPPAR